MTLEELEQSGCIIFKAISGSKAYGLDGPDSDTDIKGVYILPKDLYYSLQYVSQINDEKNDIVYYELNKFIELALKNNPNILELLYTPEDCILYENPLFSCFKREDFLSKQCESSFANYAYSQIKKARGLKKKIVNPMDKNRKSVLDFCYVYVDHKTLSLKQFLGDKNIDQLNCGLTKLPHLTGCYNLSHHKHLGYKGIAKNVSSNDVSLSNVPKSETPLGLLYFNKDGYSTYCKKYQEYWSWVEKRNESRFNTTKQHGKNYDSKNMMHTFRLLQMVKEIAEEKKLNVKRNDREYLLKIKGGYFEYDDLMKRAELLKNQLHIAFQKSDLPGEPNQKNIEKTLFQVREKFYQKNSLITT